LTGAALPVLQLLVYDSASHSYGLFDCPVGGKEECPHSLVMVWDVPAAYEALSYLQYAAQVMTALGLTALVGRRTLRASPRARWIFLGLLAVAVLVAVRVVMGNILYVLHRSREFEGALFWTAGLAQAGVAGVLLHGLLRRRLAYASVSSLLVELGRTEPVAVERAVRQALKDPGLRLGFWLHERNRYVDVRGAPIDPPAPESGAGVTLLEHDGDALAVILHDPSLDEEPGLVEAAGAAAGLVLQNARLQAELRARLLELDQSRKRIVQAGDAERRRLERDIHDGAQQRLVALAVSLRVAEHRLPTERLPEVEQVLAGAVTELRQAVSELRELARGVYPAILTEEGLDAALESLVARSPVPVRLGSVPSERPPADIEATAYFVVSEALTNAAKHAQASRVRVEVRAAPPGLVVAIEDDGVGGADPARGSGLSGLVDRVGAHGGRLRVDSPPGEGTSIVAELPCEL
jgi:signal transduction histidine kinase